MRSRQALMACLIVASLCLGGCASEGAPAPPAPREPVRGDAARPIEWWVPMVLGKDRLAVSQPIRLTVRALQPGEVDSQAYEASRRALQMAAGGGAAGAVLVTSVPAVMGSAAVLVGGVLVAIGGAAILGAEKRVQDQIVAAVAETPLPQRIRVRLSPQLKLAPDGAGEVPWLEVLTVTFGVVEDKPRGAFCVVSEVLIRLTVDGVERYRDRVLIHPEQRSRDAPAPDCRSREAMAENGGAAIRSALEDQAAALPVLLRRRLPGLPWRS